MLSPPDSASGGDTEQTGQARLGPGPGPRYGATAGEGEGGHREEGVTHDLVVAQCAPVPASPVYTAASAASIPPEPGKTAVAGAVLLLGFLATTLSLALTHDHVPLTDRSADTCTRDLA